MFAPFNESEQLESQIKSTILNVKAGQPLVLNDFDLFIKYRLPRVAVKTSTG